MQTNIPLQQIYLLANQASPSANLVNQASPSANYFYNCANEIFFYSNQHFNREIYFFNIVNQFSNVTNEFFYYQFEAYIISVYFN